MTHEIPDMHTNMQETSGKRRKRSGRTQKISNLALDMLTPVFYLKKVDPFLLTLECIL